MALNITINKTAVAASYPAGSTVATAVASGGTTPYTYSLGTGGDYFSIDASTGVVTTKALMDVSSIQSFSVTVTDSNSTPESITSGVVYPNIQATQQSKFNKSNVIYKIVNDIDLGNAVLTIPTGCTLDFAGGSIINGELVGTNTKIISGLQKIFSSIVISGTWTLEAMYPQWFGAVGNDIEDDTISFKSMFSAFKAMKTRILIPKGIYKITESITVSYNDGSQVSGKIYAPIIEGISYIHEFNVGGGTQIKGYNIPNYRGVFEFLGIDNFMLALHL